MKSKKATYSFNQILSSIVMLCALAWLTISLPFVYAAQQSQQQAAQEQQTKLPGGKSTPLPNATEERSENGVNTLSEYLHEANTNEHVAVLLKQHHKCHASNLYFAFHPELISPPPEV